MRKNNMLRIASVLLVAVLLTTCAISGAFAKYYSTKSDNDAAQVAKWGLSFSLNDEDADLFYDKYDVADTDDKTVEAVAGGNYKLVAPGTEGGAWTPFVITTVNGYPEVDFAIDYDATVTLTGWLEDTYCPIVFTIADGVDGTEDVVLAIDNVNINTPSELAAAVEEAIEDISAEYQANNTATVAVPTISWVWAIGGDSDEDTALGNAAAAGNPAKVSIQIDAKATQIGD